MYLLVVSTSCWDYFYVIKWTSCKDVLVCSCMYLFYVLVVCTSNNMYFLVVSTSCVDYFYVIKWTSCIDVLVCSCIY